MEKQHRNDTAKQIAICLTRTLYHLNRKALPNAYPVDWYECDVFEVRPSMLCAEYEIKISKADFKNDQLKGHKLYNEETCRIVKDEGHKWRLLQEKDKKCPNYFYFVVPENLILPEEVPEWAGLIYALPYFSKEIPYTFKTIKDPKRIHSEKMTQEKYIKFLEKFYFRELIPYCRRKIKLKDNLIEQNVMIQSLSGDSFHDNLTN